MSDDTSSHVRVSHLYDELLSCMVMYKGIAFCVLNFDQISQSTAEILLLQVPKSKRSPY